jgi:hypothetical protein
MAGLSQVSFVRGQGFPDAKPSGCALRYGALMFQPKMIGILVAAGIVLQRAEWFLLLAAILWWNVLVPARNPFDALYNPLIAARRRLPCLGPAPAPRLFSQGMAGTFMLLIGVSLLLGWSTIAWVAEALLVAAMLALLVGRFCLGSSIFNLLRGRKASAATGHVHPS